MTSGSIRIAGSTIANNAIGVNASAGNVAITSSNISGNATTGVDANGSTAFVLVSNCELTMNGRGVRSQNSGTVRITHNDILFNSVAPWEILSGGKIETHVDNRTRGTGIGTLTTVTYP